MRRNYSFYELLTINITNMLSYIDPNTDVFSTSVDQSKVVKTSISSLSRCQNRLCSSSRKQIPNNYCKLCSAWQKINLCTIKHHPNSTSQWTAIQVLKRSVDGLRVQEDSRWFLWSVRSLQVHDSYVPACYYYHASMTIDNLIVKCNRLFRLQKLLLTLCWKYSCNEPPKYLV